MTVCETIEESRKLQGNFFYFEKTQGSAQKIKFITQSWVAYLFPCP